MWGITSNDMDNLRKTIDNFFKNKYSRREYFAIQHEFEKGETNQPFLNELEKQWNEIRKEDLNDFDQNSVWGRIVRQIEFRKTGVVKNVHFWNQLQRVAAILFLPLLLGSIFYFLVSSPKNEGISLVKINCPTGARTEFQLPDGSKGVLNSKSTLEYATNFINKRVVHLTGEAFFSVVKSQGEKFNVLTDRINVEVLGTKFSVMSYKDQSNEEVVLKSGSVKVFGIKKNEPLSLLVPDQQFTLDKDKNQFFVKKVNANALTSWVDGKLDVDNERFEDVAKRLSRWYDVQIEIEGAKLKEYRYYGTFENEPLNEVLRLLSITAPIKYHEIKRVQYKDGSFSKRKIILQTDEKRMNHFNN